MPKLISSFKKGVRQLLREARKLDKNRLEVILYHSVSQKEDSFNTGGRNISPQLFEAQMQYIQKHYQVVSLEEALKKSTEAKPYLRPLAAICFDDGYENNVSEAYPILNKLQIPATIFVCGSVIGNTDLLWRDKVRFIEQEELEADFIDFLRQGKTSDYYHFPSLETMSFYQWSKSIDGINSMTIQDDLASYFQRRGMNCAEIAAKHKLFLSPDQINNNYPGLTFGNHSWSHPLMTLLDRKRQVEEIKKNDRWLRDLGIKTRMFAVPFAPFDTHTISGCLDVGYKVLLTVSEKGNRTNISTKAVSLLNRRLAPNSMSNFSRMF